MKALGMGQWLLVGIVLFVISGTLIYHTMDLFNQNWVEPAFQKQNEQHSAKVDALMQEVAADSAHWQEQSWQSDTEAEFAALNVSARITGAAGSAIFQTGTPGQASSATTQAVVLNNGQVVGTLYLFDSSRLNVLTPLVAITAIGVAMLLARVPLVRYVVRPLEALSNAAGQIAQGNLEFSLPESRVHEVARAREAFESMGVGLRESIRRQIELEDERRFFISAIAHDLRSPLFSLRGYLEGLEKGLASTPEKAATYIEVCRRKTDQLDRLVSDLFAYTKIEYLGQAVGSETFDARALLRRAIDGVQVSALEKNVKLLLDVPEEVCLAEGDEHMIERAVENLLDNALRYSSQGGVVEVTLHTAGKELTFTVADNGPGIPEADLSHVFDLMFRGETSRSEQTGGAGLGLAIARTALLASGGDLTVANRPEGGAVFTGSLQLHKEVAEATK